VKGFLFSFPAGKNGRFGAFPRKNGVRRGKKRGKSGKNGNFDLIPADFKIY